MKSLPLASRVMLTGLTRGLWWSKPAEQSDVQTALQRDSRHGDTRVGQRSLRDSPARATPDVTPGRPT